MFSKLLGIFSTTSEPASSDKNRLLERRRKRLHTRQWREHKDTRRPLGSIENLPPQGVPSKKAFEATLHQQRDRGLEIAADVRRTVVNASPRAAYGSDSTPEVAGREAVRLVWAENRTLKKRIHHLEDALAQYKSQTADELARCKRQIEGLCEKLALAEPPAKRSRTRDENEEKENHKRSKPGLLGGFKKVKKAKAEKVKEEKASKRTAKKAKTSEAVTTLVVPLACVPPPPAPPPMVVVTEASATGAASLGEAKKNLKRRAPMADDKQPARPVSGLPPSFSLNEVLKTKNALRPATMRPRPLKQPDQDEFRAALLKKFENVAIYSPLVPTVVDCNDSFAEPVSPYRM